MAVRPDVRSVSSKKPRFGCAAHRFSHLASMAINWVKWEGVDQIMAPVLKRVHGFNFDEAPLSRCALHVVGHVVGRYHAY